MDTLLWVLGATFLVSIISFIGVVTLAMKEKLENMLLILVSLAAGGLLGGAFIHLLPEAVAEAGDVCIYVLLGILSFFIIERFLKWRHCHEEGCEVHSFAYMNLFGDAVHNFIDGIIIAAGFLTSIPLGITTTIAIALHEIPQEMGDFGVLVYGGFSRGKALFYNFLSALTCIIGALITYVFLGDMPGFTPFLLAFAAGGFIYISLSDLVPELHKERDFKTSIAQILIMLLGIMIMWVLLWL